MFLTRSSQYVPGSVILGGICKGQAVHIDHSTNAVPLHKLVVSHDGSLAHPDLIERPSDPEEAGLSAAQYVGC